MGGNPFARLAVAMFAGVVGVAAALAVWSALGAAGDADDAAVDQGTDDDAGAAVGGELVVSAAASLGDAFAHLATAFEDAHAGTTVTLNLGGSATLATQVAAGAPVDVIATADERVMDDLDADGLLATAAEPVATTTLRIVVPAGNPGGVVGVDDLADPELFVGLCAAGQPCGDYARRALRDAGIDGDAVADTAEPDVRALLAKVRSGELDAGVVYATDALVAGDDVEVIALDGPTVTFPVAVVVAAPNPTAAEAFVDFVASDAARDVFAALGFGPAP